MNKEEREIIDKISEAGKIYTDVSEKLKDYKKQLSELRGPNKKEFECYVGKYVKYEGICMKVLNVRVNNDPLIDFCFVTFSGCGIVVTEENPFREKCVEISDNVSFAVHPDRYDEDCHLVYNLDHKIIEITEDEYRHLLTETFNKIGNYE